MDDVHIHMDGRDVILFLEVERDESVGVLDAVNEVAASLDHALVDKFAERLSLANIAVVIEELVPETAVDQVTRGMLGTTHIEVHLTPIFIGLLRNEFLIVVRIHVTQIVGRRACKARHGVQFQRVTVGRHPTFGAAQRRLTRFGRQEFIHFGQLQGQIFLIECLRLVVLIIIDGERLAPIALTTEDGIAQAIVHLDVANARLLDVLLGLGNSVLDLEAVELQVFVAGVDHNALLGVKTLLADVSTLNQRDDGQVEVLGESIVTAVVGRHSHDGTRSVTSQHIVTDIDGNPFLRNGIDGITAGEHATYLLLDHALALGLVLHLVKIGIDGGTLVGSDHIVHVDALGSQYHEGNSKDGVGTSGENQEALVAVGDGESHLGTLAITNPVALGFLDGLGPLDGFQVAQQASSIGRYAQAPLTHHLLLNGISAAHRHALAHLVVGKHSTQLRAPVHHRIAQIGNAVIHEHVVLLYLSHGIPLVGGEFVGAASVGIAAFGTILFKVSHQFLDGAGFVQLGVVITLEHLQEGPLCPLVVLRVTGAHLAVPIVAETYFVQLIAVARDVIISSDFRMLARLDSILLSGQTIGVIAHGMQHVKAFQAFVARIYVAGNIAQGVSHVQSCSRRIGEHVEHVEFRAVMVYFAFVGVIVTPVLLPLFLYLFIVIVHYFSCLFLIVSYNNFLMASSISLVSVVGS